MMINTLKNCYIFFLLLLFIFPSFNNIGALKYSVNTNLSKADTSLIGEHTYDYSGTSVLMAGDINGDGYQDILIGAMNNSRGGKSAGAVYLIYGKSNVWSKNFNLTDADAIFIGGTYPDKQIGNIICAVGDINGDGYDDFIIGGGNDKLYLFFGDSNHWKSDVNITKADVIFNFEFREIQGIGDTNGDGYNDILIIGYWDSYIFFGKSSSWNKTISEDDANMRIIENPRCGQCKVLNKIGDINGDHFDDILITDFNSTNSIYTFHLFFGRPNWPKIIAFSDVNATIIAKQNVEGAYFIIAGCGDINGDGFNDILIGSPWNEQGGTSTGMVYILFGREKWDKINYLSNANASIIGFGYAQLGTSVMGIGDVNGDHYDDILIGASGSGINNSNFGWVYLILGRASGWKLNNTLSIANASFIGEASYDHVGFALSGNGDVNGDGYDDILIGADQNDSGGQDAGKTYLIFPDENIEPSSIQSIKAYADSKYTNQIATTNIDDSIYLELDGVDSNTTRSNIVLVNISSAAFPVGFQLRLYETNATSGIFRGNFSIKDHTEKDYRWFKAFRGDTVTISSIKDPNIFTTITIPGVTIIPTRDTTSINENDIYNVHYSYVGHSIVNWHFMTNASWLSWDNKKQVVSGIPDNRNVGSYRITINVTDGTGYSDEHDFILRVINRPPTILTKNINSSLEDHLYSVDYNSSEDGQGTITWHLRSSARWLSINSSSGVLSGTPGMYDIGTADVNISIDDGNGGWAWTNFALTVVHVKHVPRINTIDIQIAYEDTLYEVYYSAFDADRNYYSGKLNWTITTNASWLILDPLNASFYGTPDNGDVGLYYVNITVRNPLNASNFHNFTLTAINFYPTIKMEETQPVIIYENRNLSLHFDSDEKGEERTTWQFKSNATWLTIDKFNGNLSGIPRFKDVGTWWVNVTIDDGNGGRDWIIFTIIVLSISHPPSISNIYDQEATVNSKFTYQVNAIDIDRDILFYYLIQGPTGMSINKTGLISWIPTWDQEDNQSIFIQVSDRTFFVNESFKIFVHPWGGHLLINITAPLNNQTVSGLLAINGTVSGPNGTIVWIETENISWMMVKVNDNNSWTYEINTTMLSDGNHILKVRATWGGNKYSSEIIVVNYNVRNAKIIKTKKADNGWILWLIILILFVSGLMLIIRGLRRIETKKIKRIKKQKKSW